MEKNTTAPLSERGILHLLVAEKLLTEDQLAYARRVGAKISNKSLLDVMLDLDYFTLEQVTALMQRHLAKIQTAPLLMDLGLLAPEAVAGIQKAQLAAREPSSFLDELLRQGVMDERTFAEALSRVFGLPLVDLAFRVIDRALVANAPREVCLEHVFIPLCREGEFTLVALADPLEQRSRDAVGRYFGTRIRPCMATRSSILEALEGVGGEVGADGQISSDVLVEKAFTAMIAAASEQQVSAIHLEPVSDRLRVRFRRDGVLHGYKDFAREFTVLFASRVRGLPPASGSSGQILEVALGGDRPLVPIRANFSSSLHGEAVVLHLLDEAAGSADIAELGMSPRMLSRFAGDLLGSATGVVLIAGGGGMAAAATLQCVARQQVGVAGYAVVSAEEHVTSPLAGVMQITADLQDGAAFAPLLNRLEQLDPDTILIANLPGAAACQEVLQAALRGRKLVCGCAATDTMSALSLFLSAAEDAFSVAWAVNGILAQRLVRRVCPDCAKSYIPSPMDLSQLGLSQESIQGARFMAGQGCKACNFTGTSGRIPAFELLPFTELVREAIIARKNPIEIMRISKDTANFVTLFEDGLVKAAKGRVSLAHLLLDIPRFSKPRPLNELKRILGEHS